MLPDAASAARDVAARLRAAGLRVTAPRLAAYDAVAAQPHADADEVVGAVRAQLGTVSVQGVYDALRTLAALGLVRRIEPAGSPARYEARAGDNHHHLVCRLCAAVVDVDCAVGRAPCLAPSDDHGFVLDEAEVVYWGTCPSCTDAASAALPGPTPSTSTDPPADPAPRGRP